MILQHRLSTNFQGVEQNVSFSIPRIKNSSMKVWKNLHPPPLRFKLWQGLLAPLLVIEGILPAVWVGHVSFVNHRHM